MSRSHIKELVHFFFPVKEKVIIGRSTPPKEPHQVLADLVDDLMEVVLEKNGNVILLENGSLKNYQRMVLITRY